MDLYNSEQITKEEALKNATSASDLELKMSGLVSGVISDRDDEPDNSSVDTSAVYDDTFDLK